MVGRTNNAGSALFRLGHQGKQLDEAAGIGFLSGSVEEPGVMSALPKNGCHVADLDVN